MIDVEKPDFALAVLFLCRESNMSRRELAKYLGINEKTVYGITKGSQDNTRIRWIIGEKIRVAAKAWLTLDQYERCGLSL